MINDFFLENAVLIALALFIIYPIVRYFYSYYFSNSKKTWRQNRKNQAIHEFKSGVRRPASVKFLTGVAHNLIQYCTNASWEGKSTVMYFQRIAKDAGKSQIELDILNKTMSPDEINNKVITKIPKDLFDELDYQMTMHGLSPDILKSAVMRFNFHPRKIGHPIIVCDVNVDLETKEGKIYKANRII